ncbi:AMP-binding protein [Variovorax sp. WS11]|nr:AMP-binding protein [Variovorax sp. WS11]
MNKQPIPGDTFDASAWPLRQLTLPRGLAQQALARPDKVFLTELATGRTFTYGSLDAWTTRLAQGLHAIGVARAGHVGVLMENSAEHLALFFALGKVGAVSVPINTAARGELLHYYVSHAECSSAIVDAALLPRLAEVLPQLPLLKRVLVVGQLEEAIPLPAGLQVFALDALAGAGGTADPLPCIDCHELLLLAFTSGTTGPSKASMLSHAAALTYGTGAAQAQRYRASDVFYVCLPLFHNNALLAAVISALVCGGSVVLSPRFSVSRFWGEIRQTRATVTNLLGAMTSFLWSAAPSPADADHQLRLVSMAPVPKHAREFEQRFGLSVMSNYGLSDFGMATSFTDRDPKEKLGSIGRPRSGMQVRIADDDDFEVPDGQPGEILLRAEEPWRAATGYFRMPEATLAAHRNQWFHTGDRGMRDADGYFWFVDRKKDCIRRRGENISAFEVEQILMRHPAVAHAAVVPVTTATNDEEVAAVIVRHEGVPVQPAELVEHCRLNMAYFMVPRYLQFRDALPTTASRKVEKFRLKEELQRDIAQAWDREAAGIAVTR